MDKGMIKSTDLLPSGMGWLRAGITSIPIVGGGLDHLLFDRYAEIQQKNIKLTIEELSKAIVEMDEQKVSKEWFESEEALGMLRNLFGRILYEKDATMIKALSNVFCRFGTLEHKDDPNKYAVFDTISKLNNNQRAIFKALNNVPERAGSVMGGDFVIARWKNSIIDYCQKYEVVRNQLSDDVNYDVELSILTSFNLIINLNVFSDDYAYKVTGLGILAYSYLKEGE